MRTVLKHGAVIDALTLDELQEFLGSLRSREETIARVRAPTIITLDGTGSGQAEVYTVDAGWELAVRRVTLDLDTASDPSTGNVPLNVAGKKVEYLRSGSRIEYAVPVSPNNIPQVPGIQTWGSQQGPYLLNSETFEVRATGLTANSRLYVFMEGIITRIGSAK